MIWALQGDQALPKTADKEPSLPTLTRLANIHDRITRGMAPFEDDMAVDISAAGAAAGATVSHELYDYGSRSVLSPSRLLTVILILSFYFIYVSMYVILSLNSILDLAILRLKTRTNLKYCLLTANKTKPKLNLHHHHLPPQALPLLLLRTRNLNTPLGDFYVQTTRTCPTALYPRNATHVGNPRYLSP